LPVRSSLGPEELKRAALKAARRQREVGVVVAHVVHFVGRQSSTRGFAFAHGADPAEARSQT